MQAASPAARKRRLRQRARLLVQGIDAAPAAEQTETGFDAGRDAPRVQADRQSAVIVDAAAPRYQCRVDAGGTSSAAMTGVGGPLGGATSSTRLRHCSPTGRRLGKPPDRKNAPRQPPSEQAPSRSQQT